MHNQRLKKRLNQKARWIYRRATAHLRALPGFMIIGAMKCGTTFLYEQLSRHPDVAPALKKEVRYFDEHIGKGLGWYQAHFPLRAHHAHQHYRITGEATPFYLLHPCAPERAAGVVPHTKLIVLLRNPIDRAFSQFQHQVRRNRERLSFEEAVAAETERLTGEVERMQADPSYVGYNYGWYSYLTGGIYVDQLQNWMKFFDRQQFLIIKSEEMFENPAVTFRQVTNFLEISDWQPKQFAAAGIGRYSGNIEAATREPLRHFFEPHNLRLYRYLDTDFDWA